MRPGSFVRINKNGRHHIVGIYLGPATWFDPLEKPFLWRFLSTTGELVDLDLENGRVYDIIYESHEGPA
jgi:hypothetical protein